MSGNVATISHQLPATSYQLPAIALLICTLATILTGCFSVTRTETDLYTITQRDTTIRENAVNMPGERENGTIYPSPRTVESHRRYLQEDSTVNRYYPAFLRFGGVEMASFLSLNTAERGAGNGLFGLYDLASERRANDSTTIFGANMYRFIPYEIRLRWFDDAPNWTVGTAVLEMFRIRRDSSSETADNEFLTGILPGYIRKRYFLRETTPYVMLVPFVGLSVFPSAYVNVGTTLDVGSLGGFNVRAYAGFVAGTSSSFGPPSANDTVSHGVTFPYFGLGVSALDFVNKTDELFIEWKDHKPIAYEVSMVNSDLIYAPSGRPIFNLGTSDSANSFPSGFWLRFANGIFPMPFTDNPHLFVGTSLASLMAFNDQVVALGFLPVRAGYRIDLLNREVFAEPFAELTYYPSQSINVGARLSFTVFDYLKAEAMAGYITGFTNGQTIRGLSAIFKTDNLEEHDSFSSIYLGIGVGVFDFFHTPQDLTHEVLR